MFIMNRMGWWAFGLVLLVVACSPTLGEPQAAISVTEVVIAAEGARTDDDVTLDVAEPLARATRESTPTSTSTARLLVEAPEVEATQTETPVPTIADPTAEVQATPTVTVEAELEDVAQVEAEPGPGPSEGQSKLLASLQSYGPAPELHNEVWLNSEPLKLVDLRGKVVMVEFWTFG